MDNGFLVFMIVLLGLMFLAGVHRRHLRSRIVKRMFEEDKSAEDVEKTLRAYDREEED